MKKSFFAVTGFFLGFFLSLPIAKGQVSRSKYVYRWIHIDTLVGLDKLVSQQRDLSPDLVRVQWDKRETAFEPRAEEVGHVIYNYSAELLLLDTTNSIELAIDSRGSHVSLKGFRDFQEDTIRIVKWEILENKPISVQGSTAYYRVRGDSVEYSRPIRTDPFSRHDKDTVRAKAISVTINRRKYSVSLKSVSKQTNTWVHSTKPRNRSEKKEQGGKRRKAGLMRVVSNARKTEMEYSGEINLQEK